MADLLRTVTHPSPMDTPDNTWSLPRDLIMTTEPQCTCQAAPKLVFPCSGASNVGSLTDRAARQMTLDLEGNMYCLAGIGGRVEFVSRTNR